MLKKIKSLFKQFFIELIFIFLSITTFCIGIKYSNNYKNINLYDIQKRKDMGATISASGVFLFGMSINGLIRLIFNDLLWTIKDEITIETIERIMTGDYSKINNIKGIYKDKLKLKLIHFLALFIVIFNLITNLLMQNVFYIQNIISYNDSNILLTDLYIDEIHKNIGGIKGSALYSEMMTLNKYTLLNKKTYFDTNTIIVWPKVINNINNNYYANNIKGIRINIDCNTYINEKDNIEGKNCNNLTLSYKFPDNTILNGTRGSVNLFRKNNVYYLLGSSGGLSCYGGIKPSSPVDFGNFYSEAAVCKVNSSLVVGDINNLNNIYYFNLTSDYENIGKDYNIFLNQITESITTLLSYTVPNGYIYNYNFDDHSMLASIIGLDNLKISNITDNDLNNAFLAYYENVALYKIQNEISKQDISVNEETLNYIIKINYINVIIILLIIILCFLFCIIIGIYNVYKSQNHRGMLFCSILVGICENSILENFKDMKNLTIDEIYNKTKKIEINLYTSNNECKESLIKNNNDLL